jgi:hypothetical protein
MSTKPCPGVALACCIGIAGCANPVAGDVTMIAATGGQQTIRVGMSSKADVIAALGGTKVLRFESGFEVWVYRFQDEPADAIARLGTGTSQPVIGQGDAAPRAGGNAEFIVLFSPSGIVTKIRVRPRPAIPAPL